MRTDVEFDSGGNTLRGWLYIPDRLVAPAPAVVMGHGFTGVKEMGLDTYAESFCAAGLAVLVLDYPGFGASDGEPRQEVDPQRQVAAYRDGLTFLEELSETNNRFGVWGSSFGGGHSIVVTALDKRVTCAVAQVPFVRSSGSRGLPPFLTELIDRDQAARAAGLPPVTIPVVTEDPTEFAMIQGDARAYRYFMKTKEKMAPRWANAVTATSIKLMMDYSPIDHASMIRVPILIIAASGDVLTTPETARELAAAIGHETTEMVELPCTHFEVYSRCLHEGVDAATGFFARHLVRS